MDEQAKVELWFKVAVSLSITLCLAAKPMKQDSLFNIMKNHPNFVLATTFPGEYTSNGFDVVQPKVN